MSKIERLEVLRKIGQRHAERTTLQFGTLPASDHDVKEEVGDMDTFREYQREHRGIAE